MDRRFYMKLVRKVAHLATLMLLIVSLVLNSSVALATKDKDKDKGSNKDSNKTYVIGLDAGHGNKDPGAGSRLSGELDIWEADIAIKVVKKAKKLIEAEGHKVVYLGPMVVRNGKEKKKPPARIQTAIDNNCDISVSVHMNAGADASASDNSVYIDDNAGDDSKKVAKILLASMKDKLGKYTTKGKTDKLCTDKNSYVKSLGMTQPAGFQFPTVLLEGGFITNKKVAKACVKGSFVDEYAEAIADGVLKYLTGSGVSNSSKSATPNPSSGVSTTDGSFESVADTYEKHTLTSYSDLPEMSGLTAEERLQVQGIQDGIQLEKEGRWYTKLRVGYLLVGILIIVYSLMLFLAFWIDKMGILFELRLLPLVSFGKYEMKNEENTERDKRYVDIKKSVIILITGVLLGIFILSGLSFRFINFIVTKLYEMKGWF